MLIEQPAGHVTTPIMPARPLCYGSKNIHLYPACEVCTYPDACYVEAISLKYAFSLAHKEKSLQYAWRALRFYARENHELRERVEALEWLREVEALARDKEWWTVRCVYCEYTDTVEDSRRELRATLAHARKEAGV